MTHRNDDKLAALQALLSISGGNIDDLERAWLISEVSQYGNPNDMWMQVFLANGATSQQFNDAAYEFLGILGYTGALPERWKAYWLAGGGTGDFSPTDIAGLKLWLDPSDISTLWQDAGQTTSVTTNGDPVGAYLDKSANGYLFAQTVASLKPTYITNVFGALPALYADGNTMMKVSRIFTDDDFSMFMVINMLSSSGHMLLAQHPNTGTTGRTIFFYSNASKHALFLNNGTSYQVLSTSTPYDGNKHTLYSESDGAGRSAVRVDGSGEEGILTGQTWTPLNTDTSIFSQNQNGGSAPTGYMAELIAYTPKIIDTDRIKALNYLSDKWGTP